jgi:tRNA-2-methylthio-N6-dimethylallyladenosine synthase
MKIYVQTYGCQMNEHDSSRMIRLMRAVDYTPTEDIGEADLIIYNTCSVRDKAEQKVYSALGRLRELKQKKKDLIIGVAGCVAQQEKETLLRRVPHLDIVVGTQNIHKLPQMVRDVQLAGRRDVQTAFYHQPFYLETSEGRIEIDGPKAYVPIMQGCDKVCSFCIVPYVRGRETSRPHEAILSEIRRLARRGIKEVMLLGQNVNSYGKNTSGELTFPELLHRINDIEGLERIRFTTSHPQDLSPELIEAYRKLDKLCEHLHLPAQSGSDSVLRRMRRGYDSGEYIERIQRLRDRCPEVAVTTDIIVGFPGETEAEFAATLELLLQMEYDDLYSFEYSPRPHTTAARLYSDDVPAGIKRERLTKVQGLQGEISLRKNRGKIGSSEEVLVEGRSKLSEERMMGRTRTHRIVNFDGGEEYRGELMQVRITGATAKSLLGELSKNQDTRSYSN